LCDTLKVLDLQITSFISFTVANVSQTQLLRGPNEDFQSNPRAALWRWRNNGGTWLPEPNRFYIFFLAKGIMSYRQIISIRLYVRLKGTFSLASRALVNTGE